MSAKDNFEVEVTASFTIKKEAPYPYAVLDYVRKSLLDNQWIKDLEVHSKEKGA